MQTAQQEQNASGRSAGYSTGLHSIRTRSPGWFDVRQVILAGKDESTAAGAACAAAGAGVTAAAGIIAGAGAGVAGRVRAEAGCGVWMVGLSFSCGRVSGGAGGSRAGSAAGGGFCAVTTGGGCSDDERQGVHELSRVKASMVGRVMASAVGIDCMQPESAKPKKHTAARFGIDSIFAAPAVD